jgi:hypothetical protein
MLLPHPRGIIREVWLRNTHVVYPAVFLLVWCHQATGTSYGGRFAIFLRISRDLRGSEVM